MPYCAQCGAGVDGFSRRCHVCKRDPFPPVREVTHCPRCEREQAPDLRQCPDCEVELEVIDEAT